VRGRLPAINTDVEDVEEAYINKYIMHIKIHKPTIQIYTPYQYHQK
jgi:hypothetical protein